jgi:hypothetical protein
MPDQKLIDAANKVGEYRLGSAFKQSVFVYGTQGSGSKIVKGLKAWAGRPLSNSPQQAQIQRVIERDLNLFDPGRRAAVYLAGDYQMMDLYYGQAGTGLHEKRNPLIAEFVHYAMGFKHGFSMSQSGRDAYIHTFGKQLQSNGKIIEGWESQGPSYNGLTATKEISRIIRWGIHHFGGKLIFEGKEVYYSQVFDAHAPRVGDTDLEARELFKFFSPCMSTVSFGKGKVVFHWNSRETVPTHVHFLSNWCWYKGKTHTLENMPKNDPLEGNTLKGITVLPIWNNFSALPVALLGSKESDVLEALAPFVS